MRVSVVITLLNEESTLPGLLDSLREQTTPPAEIILVDGGSTDGTRTVITAAQVEMPNLQLVEALGTNIAAGRNHGIAQATGEIITVTDGGCRPEPEWLAVLSAPLREGGADLVQGGAAPAGETHLEDCIGRCSLAFQTRIGGVQLFPTARSLAFTHETWEKTGGFPERLTYGEDTAFMVSAAEAGARVVSIPEASVLWRPRSSYWQVIQQFHHYARGGVRSGLSRQLHTRTLLLDAGGAALLVWGLISQQVLPWLLLTLFAGVYLIRKARSGCFAVPGWRTIYRVPLVLLAIHLGTLTGILHGHWLRITQGEG